MTWAAVGRWFGRSRARDRRRDAERPRDPVRPAGRARRDGPRADRAVRLAPARLGRAGSRGLVDRDRRGLPPPVGRDPARATPDAVAGVALTTQRVTLVVSDENGTPLRPAIVWLDQRRTEGLPPVGGLWGLAFRVDRRHARPSPASRPTPRRTGSSATSRRSGSGSGATACSRQLADRSADRRLGRLDREPGRLPAVRLQARPLGRPARLEVAGRARSSGRGCRGSSRRRGRSAS